MSGRGKSNRLTKSNGRIIKAITRCARGSRKCKYSDECVKIVRQRRTRRCKRGQRQCANRQCYDYNNY